MLVKRRVIALVAGLALGVLLYLNAGSVLAVRTQPILPPSTGFSFVASHWQNVPVHFPHEPSVEVEKAKTRRVNRQDAVREAFYHAWKGYKVHAWMADEVGPLSGKARNHFGGWATSLVDALDTLWIMDLKYDFDKALHAISAIDFTKSDETIVNTFETTIRLLGGFLAAYDVSDRQYPQLLAKAMELGELLLVSFDTPNRMPITRWDWRKAAKGARQEAHDTVLLAEIGSLTLEFTRLTELTGDGRFYDAVQRIMDKFDENQLKTQLPGMWPVVVNARTLDFRGDNAFTLGAMADSMYEYLPKQHLLLGARTNQYREMYTRAADVFQTHNFYRPMTQDNAEILFSALYRTDKNDPGLDNSMQHLACFAGGMVAMAAKIFDRADDLPIAKQLVDGCIWAYDSMPNGLMTEVSHHIACPSIEDCSWNETTWHEGIMKLDPNNDPSSRMTYAERVKHRIEHEKLPPGYTSISDRRYILRPEAVESIFIWYRISGDRMYQDHAWRLFERIEKHTRTEIANAALDDVTASPPTKADRMESFWMAETLKYLYLIFAEPNAVSLDKFVFNTEAHPFRRPGR